MPRSTTGWPRANPRGSLAATLWMGAALALGAALSAVTLLRLPAAWESGNALNHVSGAWMALADDLAHGTLYRPLHDPALGYGGTRFFPLAFALHAALARAGVPLLAAGELLSLAAALAAALGAASFLRRAGHRPWPAAALAALALAGSAGQFGLTAVRGDLPAVALSIWALARLLPAGRTGRGGGYPDAAALLVLAFLAKPTSLAAAAAGVAFLALRRERAAALRLGMAVCAGCAAGVVATDLLSGGRFLAQLAALGSGGARPADLLRGPVRLVDLLVREDRAGLVLLLAAGAALLRAARGPRAHHPPALQLAALWLGASAAAALATLGSPGTGVNHLLDLEAASALVAGAALAGAPSALGRGAAAVAAAAGLATAAGTWRHDLDDGGRLAALRTALRVAEPGAPAPLLSEDPLVPLSAGERPFLVDAWMLRLASEHQPALAGPLLSELRSGGFRAVVLLHDADAPDAEDWFSRDLGPAARAEIRGRWRRTVTAGPYHVYRFAETGPADEHTSTGPTPAALGPAR